jgi:hypothetical protein
MEIWYVNGELHRDDGPAYIGVHGFKAWYREGRRHREDGPAKEHADGRKEWFIEGKKLSEHEFEERMKQAQVRNHILPANTTEIRIQFE